MTDRRFDVCTTCGATKPIIGVYGTVVCAHVTNGEPCTDKSKVDPGYDYTREAVAEDKLAAREDGTDWLDRLILD